MRSLAVHGQLPLTLTGRTGKISRF